jgi:GTPase SAR1 family protein
MQSWLNEARQFSRQEATYIIVANKKDLSDQRVVPMTDGAKFAQENGKKHFLISSLECLFMECSALSGENIEEIFNKLAQTIIYKVDSGEIA